MYLECKAGGLTGPARIGRVTFSKSGKTIYYKGRKFKSLAGYGFKANFYEFTGKEHGILQKNHDCILGIVCHREWWISGPRKDGQDRLYGERIPVEIDEDVREEYWLEIRKKPENLQKTVANM